MNLTYLDNNATTRPAPEVVEAMLPFLKEEFGNPSSAHALGQRAWFHVQEARRRVASCLGANPAEILFTSGGTESDNLAIRGMLGACPQKRHIVTTSIEHEAVFRLLQQLQEDGYEITFLGVGERGQIDLAELSDAIREDTALVSIMLANNETGILFPLDRIGAICRSRDVALHTDAVQAIGKASIDLHRLPVDLLSLSAHKFHGPKGVGALYVRPPLRLAPQMIGGLQEEGRRGGTENVAGIVGLGAATLLVERSGAAAHCHMRSLRDELERRLGDVAPDATVIGADAPRLPNTSMILLPGVSTEEVLMAFNEQGVCASGGSACHSGSLKPSRVLTAMGLDGHSASAAVRISFSRYSTDDDVDRLLEALRDIVRKHRSVPAAAR